MKKNQLIKLSFSFFLIVAMFVIVGCSNANQSNATPSQNIQQKVDVEKLKLCEGKVDFDYAKCVDALAVSEKNLAYCDEINFQGTRYKYECYWHGIYAIGDKSVCTNLKSDGYDMPTKDDCYSRLAIALQKPEYCNEISSIQQKDSVNFLAGCISGTAQAQSDCEKIEWEAERNRCYTRIAILNQDLSSCNKISNDDMKITRTLENGITFNPVKEGCIVRLARSSLNQQVCDVAADKTGCITSVQKEATEESFCVQGKTGKEKLECYILN